MADGPVDVDAYIASLPADVQPVLAELRARIRELVPAASETIRYGVPTFTLGGKSFVHVAAWKTHVSIYPLPADDAFVTGALASYRSGAGTARFVLSQPLPYDVIDRLVLLLRDRAG